MISLNKKQVVFGKFPNNESTLPLDTLKIRQVNCIDWVYEGDEEFFQLAMLKDYLGHVDKLCSIVIKYMPHSRMDRRNDHYAFSLKTAAKLVNSMGFWNVTIVEPHSDVTTALVDKSHEFAWSKSALEKVLTLSDCESLFYPDAGAAKRYGVPDMEYGIGNKFRDFETGDITDYAITGDVRERVLIVDDLCSRGGTFIEAAIQLKGAGGAKSVSLLVAHCENNVFTGDLFNHIDTLYTSESNLLDREHPQITLL